MCFEPQFGGKHADLPRQYFTMRELHRMPVRYRDSEKYFVISYALKDRLIVNDESMLHFTGSIFYRITQPPKISSCRLARRRGR